MDAIEALKLPVGYDVRASMTFHGHKAYRLRTHLQSQLKPLGMKYTTNTWTGKDMPADSVAEAVNHLLQVFQNPAKTSGKVTLCADVNAFELKITKHRIAKT